MKLTLRIHGTFQSAFADFLCCEVGWIDVLLFFPRKELMHRKISGLAKW